MVGKDDARDRLLASSWSPRLTLLAAALALASVLCPAGSWAQGGDRFRATVDRAWTAKDAGDWPGAVECLLEAWRIRFDADGNDRFSEGLYRALSFHQRLAGQFDDSFQTALHNARLQTDHPDKLVRAAALRELAAAAVKVGEKGIAIEALLELDEDQQKIGPAWNFCATKEFDVSWTYDERHEPDMFRAHLVRSFIPRTDLPYQRSTYQVTGATSFEERAKGEQRWLEVVPDGNKPFTVRCHVTISPISYWPGIRTLMETPCHSIPSGDPYLNESELIVLNARVREIAEPLKADNQYDTILSVQRWCAQNLDYGPADGFDSYEVLMERRGVCDFRMRAMVALLRANGVPSRVVRGSPPGWHSWAEIRLPDGQWFPTDIGPTYGKPVPDYDTDFANLNCQVALVQLFPWVAPDSEQAPPFFGFFGFGLPALHPMENKVEYLPEPAR